MTRRISGFLIIALASMLTSCGSGGEGGSVTEPLVKEGDSAPEFNLPSAQGPEVSLDEYLGQRPVLLYFSMGPG